MLTRSLIVVVLLALTGTAHAELQEGWYATGCHHVKRHASEAKAKKQCKRPGDIVHVTGKPALFIAGYYYGAKTEKAATARCWKEARAYKAKTKDANLADWNCDGPIHAAYGPFTRKHAPDDYDALYRYFTDDGFWVDENGEPPCFPAGTMVTTPSGPKAIESFTANDQVISWDPNDRRYVTARVVRVKQRMTSELIELRAADGHFVRATPNHPLWSPSRDAWVAAGDLHVGDTLAVNGDAGLVTVELVSVGAPPQASEVPVWDLTIDPTHTFFADGVWVHNY